MRGLLLVFLGPLLLLGAFYMSGARQAIGGPLLDSSSSNGLWGARLHAATEPPAPAAARVTRASTPPLQCAVYEGGANVPAELDHVERTDLFPSGEQLTFSFKGVGATPAYRVEMVNTRSGATGTSGLYTLSVSFPSMRTLPRGYFGATDLRYDATPSIREVRLISASTQPYAWLVTLAQPECPRVQATSEGSLLLGFYRGADLPQPTPAHVR